MHTIPIRDSMPRDQEWKYVCFTSFLDSAPTQGSKVGYLIFQRERGSETCREHWQGYAETNQKRGLTIKQWQTQLDSPNCHIEPRKGSVDQAIDYCRKLDSRLWGPYESGSPNRIDSGNRKRRADIDSAYLVARDTASSSEEFIKMVSDVDPSGVAKSYISIKKYADSLFPVDKFKPYQPPEWCNKSWILPISIQQWLSQEFTKKDRPKCLVLVGPSRLGKTQWARSLGRHMYWRGTTNITEWDDQSKYLIFDDIDWKFIPQKKSMLTCMGDATVTDKYKAKKNIKIDKIAIVLLNEFDIDSIEESNYWKKNLFVVYIDQPLFDCSQAQLNF